MNKLHFAVTGKTAAELIADTWMLKVSGSRGKAAECKGWREPCGNDYEVDMAESLWHHEIYISDPRKTAKDKLKRC